MTSPSEEAHITSGVDTRRSALAVDNFRASPQNLSARPFLFRLTIQFAMSKIFTNPIRVLHSAAVNTVYVSTPDLKPPLFSTDRATNKFIPVKIKMINIDIVAFGPVITEQECIAKGHFLGVPGFINYCSNPNRVLPFSSTVSGVLLENGGCHVTFLACPWNTVTHHA